MSNRIHLNVRYVPVCKISSVLPVSMAPNKTVLCSVESNPQPSKYTWSFNSSEGEMKTFDHDKMMFDVSIVPGTGELTCTAQNSIGAMNKPCVWQIKETGMPESPEDCKITNQSIPLLNIKCKPGWNGGLGQTFHLELWETNPSRNIRNVSNPNKPHFKVTRLKPGQNLIIIIYAANLKGRSSYVEMESRTTKVAELAEQIDSISESSGLDLEVPLGAILGVVCSILATIIIILLFLIAKKRISVNSGNQQGFELSTIQRYEENAEDCLITESTPSTTRGVAPATRGATPSTRGATPVTRLSDEGADSSDLLINNPSQYKTSENVSKSGDSIEKELYLGEQYSASMFSMTSSDNRATRQRLSGANFMQPNEQNRLATSGVGIHDNRTLAASDNPGFVQVCGGKNYSSKQLNNQSDCIDPGYQNHPYQPQFSKTGFDIAKDRQHYDHQNISSLKRTKCTRNNELKGYINENI